MSGILDVFREKVSSSLWKDSPENQTTGVLDDKIALGVLLWVVAEADEKFLPEEEDEIKDVLKKYNQLTDQEVDAIMISVKLAAEERIDLFTFTDEVSRGLKRDVKIEIIENLFRVACADDDLDLKEHEVIRKVSNLFRLDHKEFIEAKMRVKKEYGMDTSF